MLAILEAYRAGLFKPQYWRPNILAGIIVGIVALPLAMAFSIATGVKPEQGLYTAIIAGFIVGVFGGSRVQIAGPTGAFVVILANITAQYGISGLQVATLLAGFILIFMAAVKLGNVIKFIPDPVIVGFTTGIGFIIFIGELKDFLGLTLQLPAQTHFYLKLFKLAQALPHFNGDTTLMALFSLFLMLVTPRLFKRIPGPLIAMIAATILQSIFHFQHIATLGSTFGKIPQQLPSFTLPVVTFNQILSLIGPAFTIALLGAIESLLSATAADGMAGTRHHSNQELFGQGLANIIAPLFGGFAATGAIARTATNIRSGGSNPISAITHSIFLIIVIIFLAPYAANIPLCTLAAILFVVAYNMSDIPHFIHITKHAPYYDVVVLVITFLLTVFISLVVAVNVGVILALLFFMRRMSESVSIEQETAEKLQMTLPADTIVYTIQGPFFFGAAEKIERALAFTHNDPKNIIFRLKDVPFIDMTGLETFKELIEEYDKRGVNILLSEANNRVKYKLKKFGLLRLIEKNLIFNTLTEAVHHINKP